VTYVAVDTAIPGYRIPTSRDLGLFLNPEISGLSCMGLSECRRADEFTSLLSVYVVK